MVKLFLKNIIVRTCYGLGLLCLLPLSTIFQLYRSGHFIGGGNRSIWRKPLTCSSTARLKWIRTHNISGDRY
jgi:hypothetical protein